MASSRCVTFVATRSSDTGHASAITASPTPPAISAAPARYVREWLNAQAAGGYVTYDADDGRYSLSPEQAFTLANEDSPVYIPGAFQAATAALKSTPKIAEAFRSGAGFGWHEHDHGLFEGTERFFRPNYVGNLVSSW